MIQGVGPIEDDGEYLDRFPGILEHSIFLQKKNNLNCYLYPRFPQIDSENYKTILFIGETGSGKTSSINFFLNYYLGVQFEDNIRFQLINEQKQAGSQAVSQTQNVNIYYVKPINGNDGLQIVDTPSFNDTRGINQDKIILDKIKNCFQKDIDSLSAVCFLIKASETRLTSSQQYVFSQILQIFGKDIVKNLIFLFPFFDNDEDEEPEALQIVTFKGDKETQNQKSFLSEIYDQMVEPKYIKYNNTTLYSKNNKASNEEKWDYFMNQFNMFKEEKIERAQPVSLTLTLMVIAERELNLKKIKELRQLIYDSLNQITTMKETYKEINQMEPQILALSNFTSTKTVWNTITVEHRDEFKRTYIEYSRPQQQKKISKSSASSKILTKKTQQTQQLTKVVYETKISKHQQQQCNQEITTNYEMKAQHDSLQKEKMSKDLILERIINDYLLKQGEYYKLQNEFQNCARTLQKIALKPELSSQQEMDQFQKLLWEPLNDKQKEILNEILADYKMIEELEKKGGDSQDFAQQLLKAKKEGSLKGLLLNQP